MDTLTVGQKLAKGDALSTGSYALTLQDDGNLVLTDASTPVWATNTSGADRAELQDDGNFVLYAGSEAVWSTQTSGENVTLTLQGDRNVVLYGADHTALWSTGSATDAAPASPAAPAAPASPAAAPAAPSAKPAAAPKPAPPPAKTYTVVSGDTLWAIAEKFYGAGEQYAKIAKANGLSNPDAIDVGQVLKIPA